MLREQYCLEVHRRLTFSIAAFSDFGSMRRIFTAQCKLLFFTCMLLVGFRAHANRLRIVHVCPCASCVNQDTWAFVTPRRPNFNSKNTAARQALIFCICNGIHLGRSRERLRVSLEWLDPRFRLEQELQAKEGSRTAHPRDVSQRGKTNEALFGWPAPMCCWNGGGAAALSLVRNLCVSRVGCSGCGRCKWPPTSFRQPLVLTTFHNQDDPALCAAQHFTARPKTGWSLSRTHC